MRFHLERQTGGLSRAIERGVRGMEFLLSYLLFSLLPTLFEILLVCGILWGFFEASLAIAILATVLVYVAFTFAITDWRIKFRREMNERDSEANTKAIDSLLNFETVKYFANEEHEARRFDTALQGYERAAVKSQTTLSMLNIGQGVIISIGLVGVMWLAAQGVAQGRMTVGSFVLVNTYLVQLYTPLNVLGMVYRNIKQSLTDLESMVRLLGVKAEVTDKPGAPDLAARKGEVVFDRVSFAYDPRRPILENVSFRLQPGGTLAIVGPSGAGKSTIARLLFRFYDVDQGAIRIDGQDIRDVTQSSLRRAIGVVPQDTVLFNDSIYYNIAYGKPGATRAEVEHAANLARIHDFVAASARRLQEPGRRARPEAFGRGKAARRHRAGDPQGPADSRLRRSHLGARHQDRTRDPGEPRGGLGAPHHADRRAPAFDRDSRRRNPGAGPGPRGRARRPCGTARQTRRLCRHVAAPAGGRARRRSGRNRRSGGIDSPFRCALQGTVIIRRNAV